MKDSQDRRKIITGRAGEAMAADFLKRRGYRILEMNYRCSIGEIDMVAREKDVLVFVEVKTRKSGAMGYPEQAVGLVKQKKMSQLALWYLRDKNIGDAAVRFDVVAILLLPSGNDIRLIRGAFDFIALE
ncbi:MAG: YraN family protein [Smithellaceae bacterium]|jgi:putative endonuclease|nr:YraN family protein [Smithellaceae bacterium]MDD3259627.1 YraN family protein [Smithellaceae bacterium]MDD3849146.1 YraN family protein [Smithellaceae bacterium]HOG11784.1 YraN family protein [Smithellaceae bacterium]HOQ71242.1 YraN family protein [Smithellaceae bacterium]